MKQIARLQTQRLPQDGYLATSDDVPRLVAQARTVVETLEIARDVARRLMEAHAEGQVSVRLREVGEFVDYPLVISS